MRRPLALLLALCAATGLPAQAAVKGKAETAQEARIVAVMLAFARQAELSKMPSRAQVVYAEIFDHYDRGNRTALAGLGWREVKGLWKPPDEPRRVEDTAVASQQSIVQRDEQTMRRRCATLHREVGIALLAEDAARGKYQLERALAHDASDLAAHKALGHEELDGCWGDGEEIAFLRRFRAIGRKAEELRKAELRVEQLDAAAMPSELRAAGVTMTGARSDRFTFWLEGIQADADRVARQAERCLLLLEFLVGSGHERFPVADGRLWVGVTMERRSYLAFVDANAANLKWFKWGEARMHNSSVIKSKGKTAEFLCYHPGTLDDAITANVAHRAWTDSVNPALGEGFAHVLTWLLCGSIQTTYSAVPEGKELPTGGDNDPQEWVKSVRAAVTAGTDPGLLDMLREPADRLRPESRRKAWLFMLWLTARHQDRWSNMVAALKAPKDGAQCAADFATELGRPLAEVEREWRLWARGDSPLAKATGLGR